MNGKRWYFENKHSSKVDLHIFADVRDEAYVVKACIYYLLKAKSNSKIISIHTSAKIENNQRPFVGDMFLVP